jgi:hypothetical protein
MYIRRIKNRLVKGHRNYGYYWYKSVRKGNKVTGVFVRKATQDEIKMWLSKMDKK